MIIPRFTIHFYQSAIIIYPFIWNSIIWERNFNILQSALDRGHFIYGRSLLHYCCKWLRCFAPAISRQTWHRAYHCITRGQIVSLWMCLDGIARMQHTLVSCIYCMGIHSTYHMCYELRPLDCTLAITRAHKYDNKLNTWPMVKYETSVSSREL